MDEKAFYSDDAFTSTSVTAQKLSFDDANKPANDLLLSTYQIGNNKDYPDLHVFTNSDGSWELNNTRLSIWASHITRRTEGVDKDHPPVSQWFDFKHIIKPVKTNTINPVANPFERVAGTFMPQQMGPLPPYFFPPHFYPNAPPSQSFYTHGPAPQSFYTHGPAPHGYYTHGAPPMFASSYQPALSAPTSPSNSPNVTLSSFCQFYHISDVDRQHLEMPEYRPGNRAIESLEKEE
ncbi:hypothetical protein F5051DRAFT_446349 [Lentinula edodes]|nr:hypothetical protein F5051DRAFT_446349 [Lentinula edodes]